MNAFIGTSSGQYPSNQVPSMCIDFNSTTKYLNYGTGSISGLSSNTTGVKTGFYTVLSAGAAVVNSLQMQTANDFPARDPITCTLEGSNATGAALSIGSSWTLLYNGSTGINATLAPGRYNWTKIQRNYFPFIQLYRLPIPRHVTTQLWHLRSIQRIPFVLLICHLLSTKELRHPSATAFTKAY